METQLDTYRYIHAHLRTERERGVYDVVDIIGGYRGNRHVQECFAGDLCFSTTRDRENERGRKREEEIKKTREFI